MTNVQVPTKELGTADGKSLVGTIAGMRVPIYRKAIEEYENLYPEQIGRFVLDPNVYDSHGKRVEGHCAIFQTGQWCHCSCTELWRIVDDLTKEADCGEEVAL